MTRNAIVVANGTLPRASIVRAEIASAVFVLAADGGANSLQALGITPDAVIGDLDSISVALPSTVQVIDAPDQDRTDLDKAVGYLIEEGYETISILGATGDRLDHTFAALAIVCKYEARLVDDIGVAVSVRGPGHVAIQTEPGRTVSLLPCGKVIGLTTVGLKWNLVDENFDFAERDGTSNVATANTVEVALQHGLVIVYAHHA
jgi:thiamine pyrophosphokinase